MRKRLAIFVGTVLIVACILATVRYQSGKQISEGYDVKCEQPNYPSATTASLACVIQRSHETDKGKPHSHWWDVLITWPEGITAWLLLFTLLGIVWQAWETRDAAKATARAAKATEDSVKATQRSIEVQEAEFRQWADIGEWSIKPGTHVDFQLAGEVVVRKPETIAVRIIYNVVNNTPRPLFIREVGTKLQFLPNKTCHSYVVSDKRKIAPKGDYKVIIDTRLEGFQVDLYITDRCAILAVVEIQFANALGEPDSADFLLFVTGGINGIRNTSKGYVAEHIGDDENGIL